MLNTTKVPSTLQVSHQIKKNLEDQIHEITNHPEIYAQSPFDFSRNRKLSFETTIKIILSFGGQSLSSELLSHFNFTLKNPYRVCFGTSS